MQVDGSRVWEIGSLDGALTGGLVGGIVVSMHIIATIADIQPIDGDKILIRRLKSRPNMAEMKR